MLSFLSLPSSAQTIEPGIWHLCPVYSLVEDDSRLVSDPTVRPPGGILVDADSIESTDKNLLRLSGNVSMVRKDDRLFAEAALFDQTQNYFELTGDVRYRSTDMQLTGGQLTGYSTSDRLHITDARFYFPAQHASGQAHRIERTENRKTVLHETTYTTCTPNDPDWLFRAGQITLDHAEGQGLARNMSVRFKKVPVFYFPLLSFPLDDRRKSGLLLPSAGDSDKHGFELELPYYWNIAPQADATLTPHQMSRRGIKLDSEWRYLNRWSMNRLQLEYLNDEVFGDDRDLTALQHNGAFADNWFSKIDYAAVSDKDYFDDFGSNLSNSSITHLRQKLEIGRNGQHWRFSGQLLDFQTIDEVIGSVDNPYRLLPSFQLHGDYPQLGEYLDFNVRSTLTAFEHDLRIDGERFDIQPKIRFPFGHSGWFITPALSLRHTAYQLDDIAAAAEPVEISRTVPTFSLDSGLIFERGLGKDGGLLQTLEPRLFLLKTPFRDQDDIPVFDTALADFSFAQLFSENRFVGADRVGDAEQANLALSSALLNRHTGNEILRAGIGRIFYNRDRRVTLPGQSIDSADKSNVLAEINAYFSSRWSAALALEWNSASGETDKELFRLRYKGSNRHIFNLAYRSRSAGQLEQSDFSFAWPLSDHWSAVGRWNRSLDQDINLEQFAGLQYESCCYAIRIVAREYLNEDQTQNASIFFQISLKGLAQIGDNVDELLERSVLGYKEINY